MTSAAEICGAYLLLNRPLGDRCTVPSAAGESTLYQIGYALPDVHLRVDVQSELRLDFYPPPPPPLRGRNDRMRVAKMSGKGVLFVRQSTAREFVFDFSPGDFFKKGGVFFLFLSSLWTPEKLFRIRGVD